MSEATEAEKEAHRLGTINQWDPPEGDWAAEHDWTRYRGPDPWPVPGGWVFGDPEGGGWWTYYGDAGVGYHSKHSLLEGLKAEALKDDEAVEDPFDALEAARSANATMSVKTANPDEVSMLNYESERLEWALEVDGREVFRRVEPDRSDLMAAVAEALNAFHVGELDERAAEIVPETGSKPDDVLREESVEQRREDNESLDEFSTDGGTDASAVSRDPPWDGRVHEEEDLYRDASIEWGDRAQMAKAAEELAELAAVCARDLNGQADQQNFLEELVDARIMIEQLTQHITDEALEEMVDEKMEQLAERVDGGDDGGE